MSSRIKLVLIIVSIFSILSGAVMDFSERQMKIRMNGHDHWTHDFISDTIRMAYTKSIPEIENIIEEEVANQTNRCITKLDLTDEITSLWL